MANEVNLLNYYPEFLQEVNEYKAITNAQNPEFKLLYQRLSSLDNNLLPATAEEHGVEVYEQWLKLPSNPYLPLEERRQAILAKLNETLPYTEIRLQKMLAAIVGWGHFTYRREGAFVQVILDAESVSASGLVAQMLERVLPLNLYYEVRAGMSGATLVKFIGVCMETLIIETKIDTSKEIATVYHGQPYLESATIETKLAGE